MVGSELYVVNMAAICTYICTDIHRGFLRFTELLDMLKMDAYITVLDMFV